MIVLSSRNVSLTRGLISRPYHVIVRGETCRTSAGRSVRFELEVPIGAAPSCPRRRSLGLTTGRFCIPWVLWKKWGLSGRRSSECGKRLRINLGGIKCERNCCIHDFGFRHRHVCREIWRNVMTDKAQRGREYSNPKGTLADYHERIRTLKDIEASHKTADGFHIFERFFSEHDEYLSVGIANIHARVPDIEANKDKILRIAEIFKRRKVNMAIFPEFCLTGYFWEDERECRNYMDKGVMENHIDWIEHSVKPMLDEHLASIILNNVRRGPNGKYYNSTYIISSTHNYMKNEDLYNKVFLPGIEKMYTQTGLDDRLVIETRWGRFGFTTCYDYLFSELIQEYAKIDKVDAVIQIASWRSSARRDYPGMNVGTDTYYGDLWDIVMQAKSATNQIWTIACNAVGVHGITQARFWGGSGLWAPSGLKLLQASNLEEELLIVHNVDIKGQRQIELDDFNYAVDFGEIYRHVDGKCTFTRIRD